ncbi:MAG: hypothetical protein WCG75_02660, partial [Armatimonadota bacterium]
AIEELDTNRPLVGTIARIGKSFTDEEIQRVANLWLVEKDFRKARTYANLFDVRDFPYPFKVIIDRVLAGDPPFDFEDVLSYSDEPMVRELGLTLISQESPDSRGYTCLKNAFLDEDIPFLVKSLDRFVNVDHDEMHDICTALRDICETIPTAELRAPFLIWIYEHDPCSFCRNTATDILVEDGTLPENYRQEMAFDSDSDTRALVIPKPA